MATFEVSGSAPPIPSIWRGSGVPMIRSSRSSRMAGSSGRSEARKYAPFEVPPRIQRQGIPSDIAYSAGVKGVKRSAPGQSRVWTISASGPRVQPWGRVGSAPGVSAAVAG